MTKHRITLFIRIFIAVAAFTFLAAEIHHPRTVESPVEPSEHSATHAVHFDHDAVALTEMYEYALNYEINEPDTLGVAATWTPDYELRWIDFRGSNGEIVRVYHAISRQDDSVHYVARWDRNAIYHDWERVPQPAL